MKHLNSRIVGFFAFAIIITSGSLAEAGSKGLNLKDCGDLLLQANLSKAELNMSQAARLEALFKGLPEQEMARLFGILKKHNLSDLISKIEDNKFDSETKKLFEVHPEFAALLLDLAKFGDTFSGIFDLENAQVVTLQVLNTIRTKEGDRPSNVSSGDLLKSQSMSPQLKWTINSTIANLIQQAILEYQGFDFNKPFVQRMWEKAKRFTFPSYAKVWRIIDLAQDYQRQLQRLAVVDRLIIDLALSKARALDLTQEEMAAMTFQVLNSPDEIKILEREAKEMFGGRFAIGKAAATGDFDIFKANAVAESTDQADMFEGFDIENLKAIDLLTEVINKSRERKKQKPLTIAEVDQRELQLRIEASVRRRSLYNSRYFAWTSQKSSEKYSVEDRVETQVKTGEDSKGNPIYRTDVSYPDRTVYPSFENILSNRFDRGDRYVTGLEDIQDRAAKVVEIESKPRNLAANAEEFYDQLLSDYQEILNGRSREKTVVLGEIAAHLKTLEAQITKQTAYANLSNDQIQRNYDQDIIENFKGRNAALLSRLINLRDGLTNIREALRRSLRNIYPTYDLFDFTNWTLELKSYRNWNYGYKAAAIATVSAVSSWSVSPQIQSFVGIHKYQVVDWFQTTIQNLTSGAGL